jgi:Protein of unknown function (DUF1570)
MVRSSAGWHELVSEHFTLATDLPLGRARDMVAEMERVRLALREISWRAAVPAHTRTRVTVFRSSDEAEAVLGSAHAGLFYRDLFGAPGIAVDGQDGLWDRLTLNHELAHRQIAEFLQRSPRWLSEGLACYLETLRFSESAGVVVAGEPNPQRLRDLRSRPEWTEVIHTGDSAVSMDGGDYGKFQAASWALVHFLLDRQREGFRQYVRALSTGEDPEHAWTAAFGTLDGDALGTSIRAYIEEGRLGLVRAPLVNWDGAVEVRDLTLPEVHGMRAMLLVYGAATAGAAGAPRDSDAEAFAALREDPGNPDAAAVRLFWRFGGLVAVDEAEAAARAAIRAHPSDWRSWALLGASLDRASRAGERLEARMRAAQLAPDNPTVLNSLAWDDVVAGRPQDAVPLAERALLLSPTDANVVDTYAAALAGIGDCTAALRWQRRALELVQEGTSAEYATGYRQRLRDYEARCGRTRGGGGGATAASGR